MGKGQRGRETESAAGSRLWAVSTEPEARLKPTNGETVTWAEVGRLTSWATQVPLDVSSFTELLGQETYLSSFFTCPRDSTSFFFSTFFCFVLFLFLGQRETEHERGRGRERGRQRIRNRLQAPSHQPRAWRGARTHRPRDHDLSRSRMLNRLSHPGAPIF